jgi:hypothetical protein
MDWRKGSFLVETMTAVWIKLNNTYGSEGAYCPNGFKVNYKQNQYLSQVSSIPLRPVFLNTEKPEMPRFFIPKNLITLS